MNTNTIFKKYKDYELPLLELLEKLGGSGYRDMIYSEFESNYKEYIPAEHYEKHNNGEKAWINLIWWASYRLNQKGFCTRRRGFWSLTAKGKDWLNNNRALPYDIKAAKLDSLRKQIKTKSKEKRLYKSARLKRDTLLEIKQYLPQEVFNRIFGMDWLKTQFDYITSVISGNGIRPSDFELCEFIEYCYQNQFYEEAIRLYMIIDCRAIDRGLWTRISRIIEACQLKTGD